MVIALLLSLCWQIAATRSGPVFVTEPFEVSAPTAVARSWDLYDGMPSATVSESSIRRLLHMDDPVPSLRGRVDILRRDGARWIWVATEPFRQDLTVSHAEAGRGVLLRFEGAPVYYWGETRSTGADPVALQAFRTLTIDDAPSGAVVTLFVASERLPRVLAGKSFQRVPRGPSLACATLPVGSARCTGIDRAMNSASVSFSADLRDARVLRVEPGSQNQFDVLAKGYFPTTPARVGGLTAQALPWVAVGVEAPGVSWKDVVIDRSGKDVALERLIGAELAPPPSFVDVPSRYDRGVIVTAYVGPDRERLRGTAQLTAFPDEGGELTKSIAFATASRDEDEHFVFSSLGAGRYTMKLFSPLASSQRVAVSATPGIPLDVVFPGGPIVRGHLVRTSGGTAADPARIEISADLPTVQLSRPAESDVLDRLRLATADDTGSFRVVVPLPGQYRLRAYWGKASAERNFELRAATSDLDLGEIPLQEGSVLHGIIDGCPNGEASALALPDPSKAPNFNRLRAAIGTDGRFQIDGVTPGGWIVQFRCAGSIAGTTPRVVRVPPSGELVVRFLRKE